MDKGDDNEEENDEGHEDGDEEWLGLHPLVGIGAGAVDRVAGIYLAHGCLRCGKAVRAFAGCGMELRGDFSLQWGEVGTGVDVAGSRC